jgi:hypothetical protein
MIKKTDMSRKTNVTVNGSDNKVVIGSKNIKIGNAKNLMVRMISISAKPIPKIRCGALNPKILRINRIANLRYL